jgi:hypothetical protein
MNEGTSALTLNPPVAIPRRLPKHKAPPTARPGTAEAPARAKPATVNPYMKLRFGTVCLFIGAITVLMVVVHSYMQLSQLDDVNRRLSGELTVLKKEETALNRMNQASVSLIEVEKYAVGELGMIKPGRDQVVYIGIQAEDRGETVRHEGFWGNVRQLFSTMGMNVMEFLD